MPVIRSIEPVEFPILRDMLYEAIFVPTGEVPPPRDILNDPALERYVDVFGRDGEIGVVFIENNRPVGAAWSRLFSIEEQGYGFVDGTIPEISIAIDKSFRGSGFGTQMLKMLMAEFQNAGYLAVSLSVDACSPAIVLYERLGFQQIAPSGSSMTMLKHF